MIALALGLGAAAPFMTFSYRPAVTCHQGGTGRGPPLAWALRAPFDADQRGTSTSSSGSIGPVGRATGPATATGNFKVGERELVFRCEGDRLVEYRETK